MCKNVQKCYSKGVHFDDLAQGCDDSFVNALELPNFAIRHQFD